jgi:hypothetical protein
VAGTVTSVPLESTGDVKPSVGFKLLQSTNVPDDVWMLGDKDSRLTTRDGVSTREATYVGPGRFRVCIDRKEEAWVVSGRFEAIGGPGERPGGEEWVATPLGVGRYDSAKWAFTVADKTVDVKVGSGTAYFWPADGVTTQFFSDAGAPPSRNEDGWVRLNGAQGAVLTVPGSVRTAEAAEAALGTCSRMAAEAKGLASRLSEADAAVAELGPKHVIARRQAHAACAVAHLRIAALAPSPAKKALVDRVLLAEADWKSIGGEGHEGR